MEHPRTEWGDVPTRLGALATTAALVAAIAATRGARRLYDVEVGRDRLAAEREASRYAERVSGWVAERLMNSSQVARGVVLSNASGAMIFDVSMTVTSSAGTPHPPVELASVPPGDFFIKRADGEHAWAFPDPVEVVDGVLRPVMKQRRWRVIELRFRATTNRRWRRADDGELEAVDD